MNKFEYKNLTPFKWFVLENFPFIEADFDALTSYQLWCKVVEYLNKTIDNMNLTGEQMENVTNAFIELKNYVDNYFNNLDVQDEINNKLDEMVEDGTLSNLIEKYINPYIEKQNDQITKQNDQITKQNEQITNQNNIINTLTSRMDSFTTLPNGSTTGDAELIDGRIGRTGNIYNNIGDSIRNQTQNNFDELENYATRNLTNNRFNKNDILKYYALVDNGNVTANAKYFTSNYIDVSDLIGNTLYFNRTGNKAFYNENKEFISFSLYNQGSSIQVPLNAKYFRISINLTFLDIFCVSSNNILISKTPYYDYDFLEGKNGNKYINLKQMINQQIENLFNEFNNYGTRTRTDNMFNKNDVIIGYALYSDDYFPRKNDNYFVSNFIDVKNKEKVYINYTGNHYFYDENKNPISYGSYEIKSPITVPANAKYFRISILLSSIDNLTISTEKSVTAGTPYYNYHIDQITDIPKNIHTANIFKKVVCCGDSYTSGYIVDSDGVSHDTYDFSWPAFMEKITGNKYINCSLGGRNVLTWQTSSSCLPKARTSGKAQAYIIGLMLNDISNSDRHVDLGTINDIGTEAKTYYGGMSKIVSELLTISPNAKIFIQTCPRTDGDFPSYNQAVRDIVNYYRQTNTNIHCLDLVNYIDLYNNPTLTGDSWYGHYTAMGYEQFAETLNYILSDYINNHISQFRDVAFIEYDE